MSEQIKTSEVVEREVIKLENNELIEFAIPDADDNVSDTILSVDPHDLYWKIVEWEVDDGLDGIALLRKLRDEIGCDQLQMTHLSQMYSEILRVAESREDSIKKKLEASRKGIAS